MESFGSDVTPEPRGAARWALVGLALIFLIDILELKGLRQGLATRYMQIYVRVNV